MCWGEVCARLLRIGKGLVELANSFFSPMVHHEMSTRDIFFMVVVFLCVSAAFAGQTWIFILCIGQILSPSEDSPDYIMLALAKECLSGVLAVWETATTLRLVQTKPLFSHFQELLHNNDPAGRMQPAGGGRGCHVTHSKCQA